MYSEIIGHCLKMKMKICFIRLGITKDYLKRNLLFECSSECLFFAGIEPATRHAQWVWRGALCHSAISIVSSMINYGYCTLIL